MPHINNATQTNNPPHKCPIHSRVDRTQVICEIGQVHRKRAMRSVWRTFQRILTNFIMGMNERNNYDINDSVGIGCLWQCAPQQDVQYRGKRSALWWWWLLLLLFERFVVTHPCFIIPMSMWATHRSPICRYSIDGRYTGCTEKIYHGFVFNMLTIADLNSSIFKRVDNNFNLRLHAFQLSGSRCYSRIREHFIANRIINVWNCLSPSTDYIN